MGNESEDDVKRIRLSSRDREHLFDEHHGVCHICGLPIDPGQRWEVSHPIALAAGGEDIPTNRAPAHYKCHARQTAEIDAPRIAKTRRQRQKHLGAKPPSSRPIPTRANPWGSR